MLDRATLSSNIALSSNKGVLSRKTPVLFEPDEGDKLPSGLQVHEALLTLPEGNCTEIDLQVTNLMSHILFS